LYIQNNSKDNNTKNKVFLDIGMTMPNVFSTCSGQFKNGQGICSEVVYKKCYTFHKFMTNNKIGK